MRIVLLGAPGSGKGTQAQRLMQREHIPQISTGDLLRAAVARGSELGHKAKAAMDGGRLVDDELVLGMIHERLGEPDARRGFILDGFPRNLAQAEALDRLLESLRQPLTAVVQLEVDYAELVRRISGRRCCADCGRVFNVSISPGEAAEPCPRTGAAHRLIQRPDDNEATVAERLRVYEEKTRPLIEFYRARGLLRVINAEGGVEEVTQRLEQALHAVAQTAARGRGKKAGTKPRSGSTRSAKTRRGKAPGRSRTRKAPRTASARGSKAPPARAKAKQLGVSRAARSRAARRGRRR
jgi:adenylate kinase